MRMKVMRTNNEGDRVFYTRLLCYLDDCGFRLKHMEPLRGRVFLVRGEMGEALVMKAFESFDKWAAQMLLSKELRKNGFNRTYAILDEAPPFEYEGIDYGAIEYMPPSRERFTFAADEQRREGLGLLEAFHGSGALALPVLRGQIQAFDQLYKWETRLVHFQDLKPLIGQFVRESVLNRWLEWAEWSLAGLKENEQAFSSEDSVIIHGDCAHHNFLRKKDGELALIDFDLIAEAPPIVDFLQYANRILPFLEKPEEELWTFPQLAPYRYNQAFLYALVFPADILREWNRLVSARDPLQNPRLYTLWKNTVEKLGQRESFIRAIRQNLKELA